MTNKHSIRLSCGGDTNAGSFAKKEKITSFERAGPIVNAFRRPHVYNIRVFVVSNFVVFRLMRATDSI